jgi:hypothetical protein
MTPLAVATFACSCAERTVRLWEQAPGQDVAQVVRAAMELAWTELRAEETSVVALHGAADEIPGKLGEDADFGPHHSVFFDSIVAVAHAATAVAYAQSGGDIAGEGRLAAKACVTLLEGVYKEQKGTYTGFGEHESVAREREWQRRDIADLSGGVDPELIEKIRVRALRESSLVVAGVVDGDWSMTLPHEDWPTLF